MASTILIDHVRTSALSGIKLHCHLYGRACRETRDETTKDYEHHCSVGKPTAEALINFFDEVHSETAQSEDTFSCIRHVTFHDFHFTELPANLGRVLENVVGTCTFTNCPNLSSLRAIVEQFPNLSCIKCIECPSLTSLSSLAAIPPHVPLKSLSFDRCGLRVTPDDSWDEAMRMISRTKRARYGHGRHRSLILRQFHIEFIACPSLETLPPCIGHLNKKDADIISIRLHNNLKMSSISCDIGKLTNLRKLEITECPNIQKLPWSICRVNKKCEILMDHSMSDLRKNLQDAGAEVTEAFDDYDYECSVSDLEPYFCIQRRKFYYGILKLAVLVNRARTRAIDRLYKPGGIGFEKSRVNFETMMSEHFN
jgi:hypothetical protein